MTQSVFIASITSATTDRSFSSESADAHMLSDLFELKFGFPQRQSFQCPPVTSPDLMAGRRSLPRSGDEQNPDRVVDSHVEMGEGVFQPA